MIDSIYVAMTGLNGHQRGLKAISNNVANMNTPGFKGSRMNFTDILGSGANSAGYASSEDTLGQGLNASRALLDLRAGEAQQTGRDLDLDLQGNGYFVAQSTTGELLYSRAGAMEFNTDGFLVGRSHGLKIMGHNATGQLAPIELAGLKINPPKGTTELAFTGNLSSADTDHTIDSMTVFDSLGGSHTLKAVFTNSTTTPGTWSVQLLEGTTEVGKGEVKFDTGKVASGSAAVAIPVTLTGKDPVTLTLAFGSEVTGFAAGTSSTLAMKGQNGFTFGQISTLKFDAAGVLKVTYSNGQSADGPRLVLAQLRDESALTQAGTTLYTYTGSDTPVLRDAGGDLTVTGGSLELSNVNLTEEFSALILMQRGYQASSQVLSTANDMLQSLFDMKGRR